MTKATYKQIEVIKALIGQGKVSLNPEDLERLTKESASQIISEAGYKNGDIKKFNGVTNSPSQKQQYPAEFKSADSLAEKPQTRQAVSQPSQPVRQQTYNGFNGYNGFNSARLGQAANLASYGQGNDYILKNKDEFTKRAVEIYKVLAKLEEAVKASSNHVIEEMVI